MRSCATCSRWPCFGRVVGPDDPQRSLPSPTILWFCVICLFLWKFSSFSSKLLFSCMGSNYICVLTDSWAETHHGGDGIWTALWLTLAAGKVLHVLIRKSSFFFFFWKASFKRQNDLAWWYVVMNLNHRKESTF